MTSKNLAIVLILLLIYQINIISGSLMPEHNNRKFFCPDSSACSCSLTVDSEYELYCPVAKPSIIIRIHPKRLQIDCLTSNESDYALLPEMKIGDILKVQITRCPLPSGQPIAAILHRLGIEKFRNLFFQSNGANLGVTLVKQHLQGLSDVERLYLSGNGLTDLPPDLFDGVANLTWLDLQRNKVHLPRDIFLKLTKLENLELAYNNLENLEPGVFRNQNRLNLLNLWGNKLRNLTKDAFEGLTSLHELDLSANDIEVLRPDVLELLPNLTNINLSSNKFQSFPSTLFRNNSKLMRLRIMRNHVQLPTLPDGFLSNLLNLEVVNIQAEVKAIPSNLFSGSINLRNITLAYNELTELPKDLLADQINLLDFVISNNKLTELDDNLFANTSNLITIRLSNNQIMNISGTIFQHLPNLLELFLDNNNIHRINQNAFVGTQSLQIVKLDNNFLTFMDIDNVYDEDSVASPFQHLIELRVLGLRNNSITFIFSDWLLTSLYLQELDLSYNNISIISYDNLQFLSRDIVVNLSHNHINNINLRDLELTALSQDNQDYQSNVKILLESNPLACNCAILHFIQYLRNELNPKAQKFIQLIPGDLRCASPANLQNTLAINVQPNELMCPLDIPETSIKLCPDNCSCMVRIIDRAAIVNCTNMNLQQVPQLPLITNHGLTFIELHIENNNITELPMRNGSNGYSMVREIFAQNNSIKTIKIENLPHNLTVLELSNNKIESINSSVYLALNKTSTLRRLSLSKNPWSCECTSLDLLLFVQNHFKTISDYSAITCSNGEKLSKLAPGNFCTENIQLIVGVSVSFAIICLLIGIIAALYYKYNQEIKVWLFSHNLCLWFVTEEELDKDKKYDAFISYSHKDEEFITEHLVPTLESGSKPFKLCLHIRDWIIGEWIPTQIAKSVEDSRRTVVVLSPNFLESVWGRMEFRTAHNTALSEGRARVIVIIYGDIGNTNDLDPELKAYLNMNTYVKWGDPWFWEKLRYAMPHPVGVKSKGLFKNGIKSSVDDKLELIIPSPVTPPLTTPPSEIAGQNPLLTKLNGEINQNGKLTNGINGHVNGAFIINTNSKQSDV